MGRHSLWLPLALLLFLAGVSFWLDYTVRGSVNDNALNDRDPESIVENFEAVRTDAQGRIKERLSARKLSHFSGSKVSELESPHLVQITPGMADMTMDSGRAAVSHDNREIVLEHNVVVTRGASENSSAWVLRTARLLVYPQRNLLTAPGAVSLDGDGLTINASGMVADSSRRVIKFSGRVRTRYQPAGQTHAKR